MDSGQFTKMRSLYICYLLTVWKFAVAIETGKAKDSSDNIGQFVGQLTSLLNQGAGAGAGGYLGQATGYQSPGLPYPPYPGGPPSPGRPYPPYPGPPGVPYPPPFQQYPSGYPGSGLPAPSSLYGALSSIARFDDLRCVPRLLCEVASGSRPGSYGYPSYSQESPIPFLSKDALVTMLTVLNFVDDSPLLVFGRAALLGYTSRGDSRACLTAYPTCPRDPDHLVDYLNNHNGGFFRFFNQQLPQYAPQYPYPPPYPPGPPPFQPQGPYPLQNPPYPPPSQLQRPYPLQNPPYPPSSQLPRPYPPNRPPLYSPVRPYPRYPQQYSPQHQRYQSRIQTQPEAVLEFNHYAASTASPIPTAEEINSLVYSSYPDHQHFQDYLSVRDTKSKFVFPQRSDHLRPQGSGHREDRKLYFPSEASDEHHSLNRLPYGKSVQMVFPDRTGTGDLRLDLDENGEFKTVYFASHQHRDRDLRHVKFPKEHDPQSQKMHFPQ